MRPLGPLLGINVIITRITSLISLMFAVATANAFAQTADGRGRNNPYSPSPSTKTQQYVLPPAVEKRSTREVAFVTELPQTPSTQERPTIAQRTFEIAKKADKRLAGLEAPTEHYMVGVGDVLFVDLKNSPRGSGYYTVRPDGTIDFPLAGENIIVSGQTSDMIEELLASGITLFADPKVEVKVRDFTSHKITVSGMVERSGEMSIQREAVPLYVIRAQAVVDTKATKAIITRAPGLRPETYDLKDPNTDGLLIYPGSSIEFISDKVAHESTNGYYFIAGDINVAGQKEYVTGLTLFQAILASGGQRRDSRTATIRRKNANGTLNVTEHNLRAIKSGKAIDPTLSSGDMIQIGSQ